MNYEKDLFIDENALDVEILDQPTLMFRYARDEANAERELSKAKEKLDLVFADLDKAIRKHPEKYGVEKTTNEVVRAAILREDEYAEANDEVIEAQHELRILKGARNAVDARKTSLELMVKLHGQQYFAGPAVARDLSAERQRKQQRVDSKVSIPMKKKRTLK